MNQLYLLISLLSFSVCFAQDPQLFENTWYLQNIIIDGQANFPPFNTEVNNIPLDISMDLLATQVCAPLGGDNLTFDTVESEFTVPNFVIFPMDCINQENQVYQNLYFNNFFQPQLVPRIFNYLIETGANDSKLLTLTNEEGNQAIYGNQALSVRGFYENDFALFPNPTEDILILSSNSENRNVKIKIYTIEGKLVNNEDIKFKNQASIKVSNFSKGIYFLNIQTESGKIETKKFVKN